MSVVLGFLLPWVVGLQGFTMVSYLLFGLRVHVLGLYFEPSAPFPGPLIILTSPHSSTVARLPERQEHIAQILLFFYKTLKFYG